jgi:hypothetical protein
VVFNGLTFIFLIDFFPLICPLQVGFWSFEASQMGCVFQPTSPPLLVSISHPAAFIRVPVDLDVNF